MLLTPFYGASAICHRSPRGKFKLVILGSAALTAVIFGGCASRRSDTPIPGYTALLEQETMSTIVLNSALAVVRRRDHFPIGADRLDDSVYVYNGRVFRYDGRVFLKDAPCQKPGDDFAAASYALSQDGRTLACIDQPSYDRGRLIVVRFVRGKPNIAVGGRYFVNTPHSLGFIDNQTIALLKYADSCSFRGWEVATTRLVFVSVDTLKVKKLGPCATSVVTGDHSFAIGKKEENRWTFALAPYDQWRPGQIQALVGRNGGALYLDSNRNLRYSKNGNIVRTNVLNAAWFR